MQRMFFVYLEYWEINKLRVINMRVTSNPTLSATQSEMQRNPPGLLWKVQGMGGVAVGSLICRLVHQRIPQNCPSPPQIHAMTPEQFTAFCWIPRKI
jgi:hypothetical protein